MDTIAPENHRWTFCNKTSYCIPPEAFHPIPASVASLSSSSTSCVDQSASSVCYPMWPADHEQHWIAYTVEQSLLITRHFATSASLLELPVTVYSGNSNGITPHEQLRIQVQRDGSSFDGHQYWRGLQIVPGRSVRWMRQYILVTSIARPVRTTDVVISSVVSSPSSSSSSSSLSSAAVAASSFADGTRTMSLPTPPPPTMQGVVGKRRPRPTTPSEQVQQQFNTAYSKRVRTLPPSATSATATILSFHSKQQPCLHESDEPVAATDDSMLPEEEYPDVEEGEDEGEEEEDQAYDDSASVVLRAQLDRLKSEQCGCGEAEVETCYVCCFALTRREFMTTSTSRPRSQDRPSVQAIRLPCNHAVHVDCIESAFLANQMSCGVCRASMDAHSKVAQVHSVACSVEPISYCQRCTKPFPMKYQSKHQTGCSLVDLRRWTSHFVDLGDQPDGTLFLSMEPETLPGTSRHASASTSDDAVKQRSLPLHRRIGTDIGTYVLQFTFNSFRADATYPDYVGQHVDGTSRYYFIPACARGTHELARLVRAHRQRKIFRVGYPLSRIVPRPTVVQGSLPLRSRRVATPDYPYGFPDPLYMARLSIGLDDLLHINPVVPIATLTRPPPPPSPLTLAVAPEMGASTSTSTSSTGVSALCA